MAVAGGRLPKLVVRRTGVPAAAAERFGVREAIRPDEARGRGEVETETPEVDDGETTGGLEAKPKGAPVIAAAFSELEGDSSMWSKVEMWSTETLQGELAARSWTKRGPVGMQWSDTAAGSWYWTIR